MGMVYHIRYRERQNGDESEAVVEANSPTEAMIKFRHSLNAPAALPAEQLVTSVYVECRGEEPYW